MVTKIIIDGIAKTSNDIKYIKKELIDYSKEQYISTWIGYAKKDEVNPNITKETDDAIKQFDKFYFNK